jgi:putative transcriptional regulator
MKRAWCALAAVLGLGATAFAQELEGNKLAPGRFLVASRDLGDPNFAETVVLLIDYNDEAGAMGLIINRRSDVAVSRVLRELKSAKGRADPIYLGGPVEPSSVFALLRAAKKPADAARRVFADVYLISSREFLEKTLASSVDENAFRAYLGYAGWSRDQLEHEVELGAWRVLPPDAATVFHADPDSVWMRLFRRTELRIAWTPRLR